MDTENMFITDKITLTMEELNEIIHRSIELYKENFTARIILNKENRTIEIEKYLNH